MLRQLLVSTALAGVLASGAYAQDAQQSDPAASTDSQGQEMQSGQSGTDMSAGADASASSGDFLQALSSSEYLASNITDVSVYGSNAQDAETVATIDNYLVGSDGQIAGVILTTSGDQSKTVAVPFDQISWSMQDGSPRATMSGGADLAAMPSFQLPSEQGASASGDTSASADAGASAEGDTTAASDTAGSGDAATSGSAASGDMAASSTSGDTSATTGVAADSASGSGEMAASGSGEMAAGGSSDAPTMVGPDQYLSQNLISASVVSGPGDDAENVGSLNDLVVSSSGSVEAGVIGVGGFLGIGEKNVAVPFDQLTMNKQQDGTPQIVYAADQATLEQAPSFSEERPEQSSDAGGTEMQAGGDQQASSSTAGQDAAATGAAAGAAAGAATDSAAQSADNAADSAGQAASNAADDAAQSADNAAASAAQSADNAADSASQAASGAADSAGQAADNAGDQMAQAGDTATGGASSDSMSSGDAAAGGAAAGSAAGSSASSDASGETSSSASAQSDMQPLQDTSTLTADNLLGTAVTGADGESVGDIGDIVLSPEGSIQQVVVDVGGFLGIGAKPVAISMDQLSFMQDSGGSLQIETDMTSQQFEQAPEYQAEQSTEGSAEGNTSN